MRPLPGGEEGDDLVERALRQRRGDDRDEDDVGGAHHLLAGLGEARRAIEDDAVVALGQRFEQLGEPLLLAEIEQEAIEPAQRRVGGEQVEPVEARCAGPASLARRPWRTPPAPCRASRLAVAEDEARRRLRVEVPEQGPPRRQRRRGPGEVDRQRRLSDAALEAVNRDRRHRRTVAREMRQTQDSAWA